MGVLTKILIVGFLAMYHGVAVGAAIKPTNEQELIEDSIPMSTFSMPPYPDATYPHHSLALTTSTSGRVRTTQVVDPVGLAPSQSSTRRPTRTGEDTSRPAAYTIIITKAPRDHEGSDDYQALLDFSGMGLGRVQLSPRDDYDGYGYGYGTVPGSGATAPAPDGGYGSPPATTALPPGGYGDPPPPAVDKPSVATASDPVTVTVTLETRTSSLVSGTPTIVTVTVTSTPASQVPVQNITQTVTESSSTSPLHPLVTDFDPTTSVQQSVTVPVDDPPATFTGVIHTTATMSSASHTPTHTPPKPVTDTNAAMPTVKLSQRLLLAAAVLAAIGVYLL
ncbi:hypothetical protein F4821DRAFT_279817 [Hypoxylon rubiginosum]|uniref:Uncharacterized protein n=1 Tax=Hypoxylon rubiginosum TaxID=110542 RepID=A0ACC0CWQ5_9PEZI|nr:hypothetical protein F4821DRAFT_279817 [Hypoxylon rubiginosum]